METPLSPVLKNLLLIALLTLMLSPRLHAQTSPQALGEQVWAWFQGSEANSPEAWLPTAEETLAESGKMGVEITEERKQEFLENFPAKTSAFIEKLEAIRAEPTDSTGFWQEASLKEVRLDTRTIRIVKGDERVPAEIRTLELVIDRPEGEHILSLGQTFQTENKWVLGGSRVFLKKPH